MGHMQYAYLVHDLSTIRSRGTWCRMYDLIFYMILSLTSCKFMEIGRLFISGLRIGSAESGLCKLQLLQHWMRQWDRVLCHSISISVELECHDTENLSYSLVEKLEIGKQLGLPSAYFTAVTVFWSQKCPFLNWNSSDIVTIGYSDTFAKPHQ